MKPQTPFVPSVDDFAAVHYGVPVACASEDGDLMALGHHTPRRTAAAFNKLTRQADPTARNFAYDRDAVAQEWLDDIRPTYVVFRKPDPDRGDDPDTLWCGDFATADTPGAVPVMWLNAS